jgi:hypothetical protein
VEQRVDNQHQFWGPLATLAWGILILLGLVITQAITVAGYIVLAGGAAPRAGSPALESLKYDGRLLSKPGGDWGSRYISSELDRLSLNRHFERRV